MNENYVYLDVDYESDDPVISISDDDDEKIIFEPVPITNILGSSNGNPSDSVKSNETLYPKTRQDDEVLSRLSIEQNINNQVFCQNASSSSRSSASRLEGMVRNFQNTMKVLIKNVNDYVYEYSNDLNCSSHLFVSDFISLMMDIHLSILDFENCFRIGLKALRGEKNVELGKSRNSNCSENPEWCHGELESILSHTDRDLSTDMTMNSQKLNEIAKNERVREIFSSNDMNISISSVRTVKDEKKNLGVDSMMCYEMRSTRVSDEKNQNEWLEYYAEEQQNDMLAKGSFYKPSNESMTFVTNQKIIPEPDTRDDVSIVTTSISPLNLNNSVMNCSWNIAEEKYKIPIEEADSQSTTKFVMTAETKHKGNCEKLNTDVNRQESVPANQVNYANENQNVEQTQSGRVVKRTHKHRSVASAKKTVSSSSEEQSSGKVFTFKSYEDRRLQKGFNHKRDRITCGLDGCGYTGMTLENFRHHIIGQKSVSGSKTYEYKGCKDKTKEEREERWKRKHIIEEKKLRREIKRILKK